jgi:hypothetical protein
VKAIKESFATAALSLGIAAIQFLGEGAIVWAEGMAEAEQETCGACHADRSKAGPKLTFIDPEVLAGSEHSDLSCIDCHTDASEKILANGRILPHPKNLSFVKCTSCHHSGNLQGAPDFSPMRQYKTSVHGRASIEKGDMDVATCSDCHGKHNIRAASDPESTIHRANIPRTCAVCHENMQMILKHNIHVEQPYSEYQQSVHGKALFIDGLATVAAVCTDCHGVHDIQANGEANLKPHLPSSCGKCHLDEYMAYGKSIHGKAFKEKISDAPVCADCHGEHRIAAPWDPESSVSVLHVTDTCAACHDDVAKMSKYNILTDKVSTFRHSDHGMGSDLGIISVATCVSCHGYHDILPADDQESAIHLQNRPKTCGKANCHPLPAPELLNTKIHIDKDITDIEFLRKIRTLALWSVGILFVLGVAAGLVTVSVRIRRNAVRSSSFNGEGTRK